MIDLIELLNETSAARILFYLISFILILGITLDGIADIVRNLRK